MTAVNGWLWLPRPQTETELVICSMVWQSVPPLTVTLYLRVHNDRQCWAFFAVPLLPISLLLLSFFFLVFPDLSVLSTLFLGQIRRSCIPGIPAAYVRNSIQLLWARKGSPSFPSLYLSPILYVATRLHLVCTRRGRTWLLCQDHLHLPSPFPSEGVRQSHMTVSVEALRQALIRKATV